MNVIQHPLKSIKGPSIKKGWLRKKARKGLFKNWKTRFFVIANGKISYYRNEISEYPYGNSLKGVLNLYRAEVVDEHSAVINNRQVFIVSYNGENNLLLEAQSAEESLEWREMIKSHIRFYNNLAALG
eukprot:gene5677-6099_t